MNREMEERIVAMYFDNEDFEKNAKTTIDTLGQLKKSLQFEDSGKSFDIFDKISKTLKFDNANKGLQKMKSTLSNMKGAVGNIFKLGTDPLREAQGAISTLNGYISKYVGFDIAGKLVNGIESAVRTLTIAPISAGWSQYETQMDSVKTIMSSTGESIDVVNSKLNEMTDYANKTIYSLTDMTSNLGKFTNNGVKLDDAVVAMEGIANATAHAGQGAQQASMAMYNISQAIGVGKMTTIDWKSLENANIATSKLKETFLEMAAVYGKVEKKVSKNGSVSYMLTKGDDGKKLKQEIELTTANFREYLSKGWLDKNTMINAFKVYSGSITEAELEAMGIHDNETKKKFMELGKEALEAATQVRTFSKMMDALKESAQSGWARSFELIFGNMEEGTTFWTKINDRFDKILSASADKRNKILKQWRKLDENGEKIGKDKKGNTLKNIQGGRDIMVSAIEELMDLVERFSKVISEPFKNVFGEFDAKSLMKITVGFRDFVRHFSNWLGSTDDAGSRFNKLQKGINGVANIIKVVIRVAKAGFNLVKKLATPVVDVLIDAFSRFGEFFEGLGDMNPEEILNRIGEGIHRAWNRIKEWFTPQDIINKSGKATGQTELPVITWLKGVWEKLKAIVKEWAYDTGLGGIWESISSWWGSLRRVLHEGWNKVTGIWDSIKKWFTESGIATFLSNTWGWISGLFVQGTNEETGEVTEAPIVGWLSGILTDIQGYWNRDIMGNPLWTSIYDFASNIWAWIKAQVTPGTNQETGEPTEAPIVTWLSRILEGIQTFWKDKILGNPIWTTLHDFASDIWGWIKAQVSTGISEETGQPEDPPIVGWLTNVFGDINTFWHESIVGNPIWESIHEFASNIWAWIKAQVSSGTNEETGEVTEAPIVRWLSTILSDIETFWNEHIVKNEIWESIHEFASNIWEWIKKQVNAGTDEETGEPTKAPVVSWLSNILDDIIKFWNEKIVGNPIWTTLHDFASNIWGWIQEEVTPGVDQNTGEPTPPPVVEWLSGIWKNIQGVWDQIVGWNGWKAIGSFISDFWGWLAGLFGGEDSAMAGASEEAIEAAKENTQKAQEMSEETEKSVGFFQTIFQTVGDFIQKVMEAIGGVTIPPEVTKFLQQMFDFMTGALKIIGDVLGSWGRLFKGELNIMNGEDWADIGNILISIVAAIVGVMATKWGAELGGAESFAKQFMELAIGMTLLAAAISILSMIDKDKMLISATVIGVLGLVISGIMKSVTKIADTNAGTMTPGMRVLNNLVNKVSQLGMLYLILEEIPKIIGAIGNAKKEGIANIGDDLLKTAEAVGLLFAGISIIMVVLNKFAPGGLDIGASIKSAAAIAGVIIVMNVFMAAIGGMAEAVDGIFGAGSHEAVLEALNKAGESLYQIGQGFGKFFQGIWRGITGIKTDSEKVDESMEIFGKLTEATTVFDMEKISGISRMMSLISQLSSNTVKFDTGKMASFGQAMGEIGEGIYNIASYLQNIEGPLADFHDPESVMTKKLQGLLNFVKMFGDSLTSISDIGSIGTFLQRLDTLTEPANMTKFIENINEIIRNIGKIDSPETGIQFDGLTIVSQLFDAIQEGLNGENVPAFDATAIIDSIVLALTNGSIAIAQIVHDMVQQGIDLSGGTASGEVKIPEYLIPKTGDENSNILSTLFGNMDTTAMESQLSKITTMFSGEDGNGGFLGDLNNFKDQIPDMSNIYSEKGWDSLFSFKDENGKEIDMVSELQSKMTELNETLNTMEPIQVKITPIFSFENLTADSLRSQLGANSFNLPIGIEASGLKMDYTGLNNELDLGSIRQKLDTLASVMNTNSSYISSAISNLSWHIDSVSSAVSRMSLYLDTGALVGGIMGRIDAGLNRNAMWNARQ